MGIKAVTGAVKVNARSADTLSSPSVAALESGGLVVTWSLENFDSTLPDDVRMRLFAGSGTPRTREASVASAADVVEAHSDVIGLADGAYAVTWEEPGSGDTLLRLFDRNGDAVELESPVPADLEGVSVAADMAQLSSDRILVAWTSNWRTNLNDGDGSTILARLHDGDGLALGPDFIVNTKATGAQDEVAVAALRGGRFAVTWGSAEDGGGAPQTVRGRVFEADGTPVGRDFVVSNRDDSQEPDVTALGSGFVVTWRSWGPGPGISTKARIYDADGDPKGGAFVLASSDNGNSYQPELATLDDGRFVAVWDDGDVRARIFTVQGEACGPDFKVNRHSGESAGGASVTALPDGRFAVTWQATDLGSGDDAIRMRIFDASVFKGTRRDDAWTGGSGDDRIEGARGSDRLAGGGGGDTFIYRMVADSPSGADRDRILDFGRGDDVIDLSPIDAREGRSGNQAFDYIRGGDFTGTRGELRFSSGILAGDVDGDGLADLEIALVGVTSLRGADLIL